MTEKSNKGKTVGRSRKTLAEIKEEIELKKNSIKTIIESGKWASLREIESLITRAMADELRVNHTRFTGMFRAPQKFTFEIIHKFCYYIDTDPNLFSLKVNSEIAKNIALTKKLKEFNDIREIKAYTTKYRLK